MSWLIWRPRWQLFSLELLSNEEIVPLNIVDVVFMLCFGGNTYETALADLSF